MYIIIVYYSGGGGVDGARFERTRKSGAEGVILVSGSGKDVGGKDGVVCFSASFW